MAQVTEKPQIQADSEEDLLQMRSAERQRRKLVRKMKDKLLFIAGFFQIHALTCLAAAGVWVHQVQTNPEFEVGSSSGRLLLSIGGVIICIILIVIIEVITVALLKYKRAAAYAAAAIFIGLSVAIITIPASAIGLRLVKSIK